MTPGRVSTALIGITAFTLAMSLLIPAAAPAPAFGPDVDQHFYLAMARAPFSGPDAHHAPFCWRILPTLMARVAPDPVHGFRLITLASLSLLPAAVFWLCVSIGASVEAAVGAAAITALAPVLVGQLSWDPIRPDALGTLLVALSATAVVRRRAIPAVLLAIALALTKETAIVFVVFALVWAVTVDPRSAPAAASAGFAAVLTLTALRVVIEPVDAYSLRQTFVAMYLPPSLVSVARRSLLATASTWTVLLPVAAWSLLRDRRRHVALALAAAIAVASAQMLVSFDTQRVVAAGWPFVVVAVARWLDSLDPRRRWMVAASLALLQLPWLLEYGRVADLRLRPVEIAIALATVVVAVLAVTRGHAHRAYRNVIRNRLRWTDRTM